jgi:hypothetical protein
VGGRRVKQLGDAPYEFGSQYFVSFSLPNYNWIILHALFSFFLFFVMDLTWRLVILIGSLVAL